MIKRAQPNTGERRFKAIMAGLAVVFLILLVVALQATNWRGALASEPELRMWFFDVGQGESVFIETPDGRQILVDGGPDTSVLQKLGMVMAPWDRTIDAVILTHPHADHVTGINHVLERYRVGTVYETGARTYGSAVDTFEHRIRSNDLEHVRIANGDALRFGEVEVDVVWPPEHKVETYPEDPNRTSAVLRLDYTDTEVLLTGDAYTEDENEFVDRVGQIDVLKVGHSGSRTSSSNTFLAQIEAEHAVISVGRDNPYGHPHPAVVERLQKHGMTVWRTDLSGDISLTSNGGEPRVTPSLLPF
jgi:competence protein ComEC